MRRGRRGGEYEVARGGGGGISQMDDEGMLRWI